MNKILGLTLSLSGALLGLARAQTYDASADFSLENGNPNGVWSYGWMPIDFTSFYLLPNHGIGFTANGTNNPSWYGWAEDKTPLVWRNVGSPFLGVPSAWLALHPGTAAEPIVLRWTAPFSGPVRVQGAFLPGDIGAPWVGIRLNGSPWWTDLDSGNFSLQANVLTGQTVDFAVYGSYYYCNTPLAAVVSYRTPVLQIARLEQTNIVGFTAPGTASYVLEFADTLTPPVSWVSLSTNRLSTDQSISLSDVRDGSAGFYRVRLQ